MELVLNERGSVLSTSFIIAGCCIGAGMIGLPVVSAQAGFIPSTLIMCVCYLFATFTGLLILEATLWFEDEVNLISLADYALGRTGKAVTWLCYLFLFYCLFVAYMDGGGRLLGEIFFSQLPMSRELGILVCVCLVMGLAIGGTRVLGTINPLFLLVLILSYCALIFLGIPHVENKRLMHANWGVMWTMIPVVLVCFGYQNLVPTLTYYVKRNVRALRLAILLGNLIPFVVYFIWNYVILGITPDPKAVTQADMVTEMLKNASQSNSILFFVTLFSLFAVITPFIANTVSFVDFLKDGLKDTLQKKDFSIFAIIFLPPMLFSIYYPFLFLKALELVGGFADVILLGIVPTLIVWVGRYVKGLKGPYVVPGGKPLLICILLLCLSIMFIRSFSC